MMKNTAMRANCCTNEMVKSSSLGRIRPRDNRDDDEHAATKKQKRARKVRIVEEGNEAFTSPYSKEDISNAWLSESDYSSIKQNNRDTLMTIIKSLGDVDRLDVNACCLRGLERHLEMLCTTSRKDVRKGSVMRVLYDQASMRAGGFYNAEVLAISYREASKRACRRGLELAYIDSMA